MAFWNRKKVPPRHVESLATFRTEVVESDLPVILDVWGPNCRPCKMMEPIVLKLSTKHAGRVAFAEFSSAASPQLATKLRISATPTVIVFQQGKEIGREMGFKPESWFEGLIEAEFPPS